MNHDDRVSALPDVNLAPGDAVRVFRELQEMTQAQLATARLTTSCDEARQPARGRLALSSRTLRWWEGQGDQRGRDEGYGERAPVNNDFIGMAPRIGPERHAGRGLKVSRARGREARGFHSSRDAKDRSTVPASCVRRGSAGPLSPRGRRMGARARA
jgi:hypothetical protein